MPVVCKSHWLWTINWVLACAPPPCLNIPAGLRPPYHPTTAGRPMSLYMDHGPAPHVFRFCDCGTFEGFFSRLDIHEHTPFLYKSRFVWFSWGLLIGITGQPNHNWYYCTAHAFFALMWALNIFCTCLIFSFHYCGRVISIFKTVMLDKLLHFFSYPILIAWIPKQNSIVPRNLKDIKWFCLFVDQVTKFFRLWQKGLFDMLGLNRLSKPLEMSPQQCEKK